MAAFAAPVPGTPSQLLATWPSHPEQWLALTPHSTSFGLPACVIVTASATAAVSLLVRRHGENKCRDCLGDGRLPQSRLNVQSPAPRFKIVASASGRSRSGHIDGKGDSNDLSKWIKGVPGFGLIEDLWKRRLRVSAALCTLLIVCWCLQGLGGLRKLEAFNLDAHAKFWGGGDKIPTSAALEGWLFGLHPKVAAGGQSARVTISDLELDLGLDTEFVLRSGQLHRLLTSCFVHCGILHLGFNVGYLYSLAPLEMAAPGAFLSTFLLSGIAGSWACVTYGSARRVVGASGAICGLIGYQLIAYARGRQIRELRDVARQTFGALIIGAFLPGTSNWAHVGGLVTGVIVSLLTSQRSGYRRALVPWPVLLLGLALWSPGRQFCVALARAVVFAVRQPGLLAGGAPILS